MKTLADIVESIREKPEYVRMRYVLLCVLFCMIILIGVWILTVSRVFQSLGTFSSSPVFEDSLDNLEPSLNEATESFQNGMRLLELEQENNSNDMNGDLER